MIRTYWGFPFRGCQKLVPSLSLPLLAICVVLLPLLHHQTPPSIGNKHRCNHLAVLGLPLVGPTHPSQHCWLVTWASFCGLPLWGDWLWTPLPPSITLNRVAWASPCGVIMGQWQGPLVSCITPTLAGLSAVHVIVLSSGKLSEWSLCYSVVWSICILFLYYYRYCKYLMHLQIDIISSSSQNYKKVLILPLWIQHIHISLLQADFFFLNKWWWFFCRYFSNGNFI